MVPQDCLLPLYESMRVFETTGKEPPCLLIQDEVLAPFLAVLMPQARLVSSHRCASLTGSELISSVATHSRRQREQLRATRREPPHLPTTDLLRRDVRAALGRECDLWNLTT